MVVISSSLTILSQRHCLLQVFIRTTRLLISRPASEVMPAAIPAGDLGIATGGRTFSR